MPAANGTPVKPRLIRFAILAGVIVVHRPGCRHVRPLEELRQLVE